MGQRDNFPSISDKATGSMSFSPICLSLPYLLQSFCQVCPELQSVQSTQKSRWRLWAANNPNRRGQHEENWINVVEEWQPLRSTEFGRMVQELLVRQSMSCLWTRNDCLVITRVITQLIICWVSLFLHTAATECQLRLATRMLIGASILHELQKIWDNVDFIPLIFLCLAVRKQRSPTSTPLNVLFQRLGSLSGRVKSHLI